MRHYLGLGFVICASCTQTVDEPTNAEPPSNAVISSALTTDADGSQTVTVKLENAHVLEFSENEGEAWVSERRPLEAPSLLRADSSAPALYRELRAANPDLPELFVRFPVATAAPNASSHVGVGVTTHALTKEEFLAGDGICNHYCGSVEFQEHSTYPFETTEKCRTDIVGRDFLPTGENTLGSLGPSFDSSAIGEKFFFSVNARDVGGTFRVHRYIQQWTFDGVEVVGYEQSPTTTKSRVIERGEAFGGTLSVLQTGEPNVYRRGTAYADLVGSEDALYDFYTCAVTSRTSASSPPGQ